MFDNSVCQKILRITGRGGDSSNNFEKYVREYLGGREIDPEIATNIAGAFLFPKLVKSTHSKINPFCIFSLNELKVATNNFNADLILDDSHSRIYRGIIEDRHVVVKIPKGNGYFTDELVILSLIKHRNVVKPLGCCLETRPPFLVHELPPNGTLAQNIFYEKKPPPIELLWTDRLRIATEIADALAYLHLELQIIHGRLWHAEAIRLDEFHYAKLCAFDFSEIQNQAKSSDVKTDNRNKFRKRVDVYYFGNILLNLLGIQTDSRTNFTKHYDKVEILKYLKLNVSEKEMSQMEAYIDLLSRCRSINVYDHLSMEEDDQLSIEEVVRELRLIRSMINHQPTSDGNESDNLSSGAN